MTTTTVAANTNANTNAAGTDAVGAAVAHHRAESWRSLALGDTLLERGELEAAAQALWEAAAHGVRAAAARRNLPYADNWELGQVIIRLIEDEGGSIDLNTNFFIAHSFNLIDREWEIPLLRSEVIYCREPVAAFLKMLEAMD